jgi:hypothetical protein
MHPRQEVEEEGKGALRHKQDRYLGQRTKVPYLWILDKYQTSEAALPVNPGQAPNW